MIQFRTFKIIWAHSPNTRNESVRILRIRGMNLFVYWEYTEWICTYSENTRNEVNIRTKSSCSCTENTRNESVCILRICGMNLCIYWEYAECTKSLISRRIRNKNRKYFRMFIRRLDRFVWPNHLKQKISCKCTFNASKLHMFLNMYLYTGCFTCCGTIRRHFYF